MTNWEFFKNWFALNMALGGVFLVTNIIVSNATGKPIHISVPGFTDETPKSSRK